jgi:hypothetical protein
MSDDKGSPGLLPPLNLPLYKPSEQNYSFLLFFHTEPPFPVVPSTFSTKLEAIIADKNMTVSAEEYFDENNNRAALFMLQGDDISKLIFDYNTEELFYVYRK